MNKAIIIGRVGKDPEIRYTQSGQAVASMSVATDESYKDQSGQKVEKAEWHRVTVWGKSAEFCGNYVGKGDLVCIEGKIQTRKWQDNQGQDRYTTEIVAQRVQSLTPKKDKQGGQSQQPQEPPMPDNSPQDDMPF